MKKKLLLLFLLFIPFSIYAYSDYYVILDADSKRVLESKNMHEKLLIASTTKIMTAIIVLEYGNLNQEVVVADEIEKAYGSMIYLKKGEKISVEDLLYGLLLQSGNDAAEVLAKNIYGNEIFVNLMNYKAKEIGMFNTVFENTHGLNDETKNYSTAYDMALLMRYAMNNKVFRKITSTKKYKVNTNMNNYIWYNKNRLLSSYKYTTGGKIGYTKASSHVFVSSASKNNKNLIIASIKDDNRFENHKSLYEKTFNNYKKYQILNKYTFFLKHNKTQNYYYIKNNFYMLLLDKEKKDLNIDIIINKQGSNVKRTGKAIIKINNNIIHSESIYSYSKLNYSNKIKSLLFFNK